ncbi:MAG TPA: hypothetical protein VL362_00020 [Patescibacteria group bacterium]|jgi:hypothetical protein|nr:hypothetical protein [Patescibacteria group bacterium]
MKNETTTGLTELLTDGLEFGWMRQRTHEELSSFIDRRHAALPDDIELA